MQRLSRSFTSSASSSSCLSSAGRSSSEAMKSRDARPGGSGLRAAGTASSGTLGDSATTRSNCGDHGLDQRVGLDVVDFDLGQRLDRAP